ncbi:hypothetical protein [Mycobacterium sp. MUNTM1]
MGDPWIRDATNELNRLSVNPPVDFVFSPNVADQCQKVIGDLHAAVQQAHTDIANMKLTGVGSLPSAVTTATNLNRDAADIAQLLNGYQQFLEAFGRAIDTACQRFKAADHH